MKPTATILIFTAAIFGICSCGDDKKSNHGLTMTANWGGRNWIIPHINVASDTAHVCVYDSATIFHVAVTIENPTADTLQFPSMTCSYEDFFLVDDTVNFTVQPRFDCYSNVPCNITLPPNTKTDRYIMLRQLTSFRENPTKKIKIGMRLKKEVIWSNELDPQRLTQEIYK